MRQCSKWPATRRRGRGRPVAEVADVTSSRRYLPGTGILNACDARGQCQPMDARSCLKVTVQKLSITWFCQKILQVRLPRSPQSADIGKIYIK